MLNLRLVVFFSVNSAWKTRHFKEDRMNIYVGNLAHDLVEDELRAAFEAFGEVASASVITDKYTQESRGFGFVEMPSKSEAQAAIAGLNSTMLKGRTLNVNEARPRSDRRGGGGGGYRQSGGGRSW
jgi:RNA recognition motif-containing protein